MTNKNYRRGYDAEKRLAKRLEKEGWFVIRSHASKGPVDLIAIGEAGTLLIEVKRTKERIVSAAAIHNQYHAAISKLAAIPEAPFTTRALALYTDPQKGESRGSWRYFSVTDGGRQGSTYRLIEWEKLT